MCVPGYNPILDPLVRRSTDVFKLRRDFADPLCPIHRLSEPQVSDLKHRAAERRVADTDLFFRMVGPELGSELEQ